MRRVLTGTIVLLAMVAIPAFVHAKAAAIRVCTTTTTLASLVAAVGGEDVAVTSLVGAGEDPRAVLVDPRFLACVRQARLLIANGLGLEKRWLPALLDQVDASRRAGGRGYLDASTAVPRSPGTPYYLLDPVHGLAVAGAIRSALEALRPVSRQAFSERYEAFRAKLGAAMVGERLAAKYPVDKLADLYVARRLEAFLAAQHERGLLGGWFAARPEGVTTTVIAEPDLWSSFGHRFHVDLETRAIPGAPVPLILTVPFSEPNDAWGAAPSEGRLRPMAPQVGARPGTDDYVALTDYNLRMLAP